MDTIWKALESTPWWVYVLLFYLLSVGKKATKTQTVSIVRLAILPLLFIVWSIYSLVTQFTFSFEKWAYWIVCTGIGSWMGHLLIRHHAIKVDKKKLLVSVPGTHTTLILLMIIFCVKYTFGYLYGVHPDLRNNWAFTTVDIVLSGVITGIFIGRFATYLYKLYHSHHTDLETPSK